MSSSTNPAPVSQPAPPRPKFGKPVFSSSQPVSWLDWTGYYTITLVTVRTRMEAAAKALPKGLKLTPSYPILLSIGIIEDARPRLGTWIGVNYYEVFSAIPGVQLEQPGGGSIGPYLYPYRGFLNRLLPVFLGRLSGFRKYWDRVQVEAAKAALGTTPKSEEFSVKTLLGGNPVMDGQYTYGAPGPAEPNQRVDAMRQLLPPNIIGVNPFGKLCRSSFDFQFDRGLAWDVTQARIDLRVGDLIPGITQPIEVVYPPIVENTIIWPDPVYAPFRAFVPWRLQSEKVLNEVEPEHLIPAQPPGGTEPGGDAPQATGSTPPAAPPPNPGTGPST
jgi:hypothetical protein